MSFLQDNRKLKFVNKMPSKLKIQLFGTEPKCRPIITGSSSYQLTVCRKEISRQLTQCKAHAEGSVRHIPPTAAHPSIPHIPLTEMFEHLTVTTHSFPSSAGWENGCCSFWKQLCPCHWSLTYIPSGSVFHSPEEQQHQLPGKAAQSVKKQKTA